MQIMPLERQRHTYLFTCMLINHKKSIFKLVFKTGVLYQHHYLNTGKNDRESGFTVL